MSNPLNLPSPTDILKIVKIERKTRLSKEYIKQCDEVANEVNGWLRITDEMQKRLVSEAGFKNIGADIALNMLRRAQYDHPNDPDVLELVYVKNNKANAGRFKAGDAVENVNLHSKDGNATVSLMELIGGVNQHKINIIFAASHT